MKKLFVRFHIGRGGRFNNQGHLSFVNEDNFQDLCRACGDKLNIIMFPDDEEDPFDLSSMLDESEWRIVDNASGRILVEGAAVCERTGTLDWDGEYNTDYVTTTDDLFYNELECLWEEYCKDAWMSDELKDAICTLKDKLRVHNIKRYQTNLECFCQSDVKDGCSTCVSVNFDQQQGEFTRDEWKSRLEAMDFCPFSVEMILDELDSCYTDTTDFFKED